MLQIYVHYIDRKADSMLKRKRESEEEEKREDEASQSTCCKCLCALCHILTLLHVASRGRERIGDRVGDYGQAAHKLRVVFFFFLSLVFYAINESEGSHCYAYAMLAQTRTQGSLLFV